MRVCDHDSVEYGLDSIPGKELRGSGEILLGMCAGGLSSREASSQRVVAISIESFGLYLFGECNLMDGFRKLNFWWTYFIIIVMCSNNVG